MVVEEGIEPSLTANLAYRGYKPRRASSYTTLPLVPPVGLEPTTFGLKVHYSDH